MRAWLEALEDKSLPSLEIADPEGEVASAFKVSLKFNAELERRNEKLAGLALLKYCGSGVGRGPAGGSCQNPFDKLMTALPVVQRRPVNSRASLNPSSESGRRGFLRSPA